MQERLRKEEAEQARRDAWHAESRRKAGLSKRVSRQQRVLEVCAIPLCERPVLRGPDGGTGLCFPCALVVVNAYDDLGDKVEADKHRLALRERRVTRQLGDMRRAEREATSRRLSAGWIYYIHVGDVIKIGFSTDVKRRLRSYPPGTPLLAMHPGTKQLETELHRQFASSRAAAREWFLDTPEMREHIKTVNEQFGEPDRARYEWRDQHRRRNLKAG